MPNCITNSTTDLRSCTIRGEHLSNCDGNEYRWDDINRNLAPTGRECHGCFPRPAQHGWLCATCFEQFEATFDVREPEKSDAPEALDLISHLRSIETVTQDRTGSQSAPGSRVIVPPSWMAADALYIALAGVAIAYASDWGVDEPEWDVSASYLDGFHPEAPISAVWGVTSMLIRYVATDRDRLLTMPRGAEAAVRWVREFQRNDHLFPREEQRRRIRWVKCRTCNLKTLEYKPPLELNEPRVITCTNPACGEVWDPQMVEFDLRVIRQEMEKPVADAGFPLTATAMEAEGIDPHTIPIHTLRPTGYQAINRRGGQKHKYGSFTEWPIDSEVWATYENEQARQILAARLDYEKSAS